MSKNRNNQQAQQSNNQDTGAEKSIANDGVFMESQQNENGAAEGDTTNQNGGGDSIESLGENTGGELNKDAVGTEATKDLATDIGTDAGVESNGPGLIVEVDDKDNNTSVRRADKEEPAADLQADGIQLSVFQTRLAWIEENGSSHEKYVKNVLQNYVNVCSTTIDLNKIVVEQKRLWRLFAYINAHPAEFAAQFNILIEFAREYKEQVFNLHMFFRGQEGLSLGKDELQCFNNLRSLVLNTIESRSKSQVKNLVDIRKIVDHSSIPEITRGQYVAFYQ